MLARYRPRRLSELNKRGQILVLFGLLWCTIGFSLYSNPNPGDLQHVWLFQVIPFPIRVGGWIGTGLVAIAYALRPKRIEHDGVAFLALYIMPAERVLGFLWSWIDSLVPGGTPGYTRGGYAACVWLVIVAAIMVCASWPNPPKDSQPGGEA